MKKLFLLALGIVLLSSCTGSNADKRYADSIRTADSIARVEAEARAEQARLDSLRQDSIKRAVIEAFNINLFVKSFREPGFSRGLELKTTETLSKSLNELGFAENKSTRTRIEEVCGGEETWKSTKYTFTKSIDGESVIVEIEDEVEITFPNAELKDRFMSSVLNAGYKKSQNYTTKDGIFYEGPSDCYYNGTDVIVQGLKLFITIRSEC